jgi:hypothetical protein
MTFVDRFLRKIGLRPQVERDEILNASMAEKAQELDDVIGRLRNQLANRSEGSVSHLREAIAIAKERTHAFEDFEKLTASRRRSNGGTG